MTQRVSDNRERPQFNEAKVLLISSGAVTGARIVPSEEIDRAFGMLIGKLRHRAGIESVAHAADGENELTLGAKAAEEALRAGGRGARELDWIIASSETHHNYPSLAAQLHSHGAESCSEKLLVMVNAAEICFAGSATLCAVSVTFAGEGGIPGAV
jgi:hypothetical protein